MTVPYETLIRPGSGGGARAIGFQPRRGRAVGGAGLSIDPAHDHEHRHDHDHDGVFVGRHSHRHTHEGVLVHEHPYAPDLHHHHPHG